MDVVGREVPEAFKSNYPDVRNQVDAWLQEAIEATWKTFNELKERYPSSSILSDNRVVFNLKGNKYRLLTRVACKTGKVIVLRAGSHEDYDHWNL